LAAAAAVRRRYPPPDFKSPPEVHLQYPISVISLVDEVAGYCLRSSSDLKTHSPEYFATWRIYFIWLAIFVLKSFRI
jgi:hypothetical protein